MEQKAAAVEAQTFSARNEARAVLVSGLSLLRIGLREIFRALWTLLVGAWPGQP